jgi:hypothetical protein
MTDIISAQHGAEAVRVRLNAVDPGVKAYDKFFGAHTATNEGTVRKLIDGHNSVWKDGGLADDVNNLKVSLARRPF